MSKLKIPARTERLFNEVRGEYRDIKVEDRPFWIEKNVFNEDKGHREDRKVFLTDYEILEAGGLAAFFTKDGKRKAGAWPEDPNAPKANEPEAEPTPITDADREEPDEAQAEGSPPAESDEAEPVGVSKRLSMDNTKAEILAFAEAAGVEVDKRANKSDLLEAIAAAE